MPKFAAKGPAPARQMTARDIEEASGEEIEQHASLEEVEIIFGSFTGSTNPIITSSAPRLHHRQHDHQRSGVWRTAGS